MNSCDEPAEKVTEKIWEYQYGRNKKEAAIDKLLLETTFTPAEEELVTCLANLILPPNEQGTIEQGSAIYRFYDGRLSRFSITHAWRFDSVKRQSK